MGEGRPSFCSLITGFAFPMTFIRSIIYLHAAERGLRGMGKIFMNLDLPKKTTVLILDKLHSISICLVHQSDVCCLVNCIWAFFFISLRALPVISQCKIAPRTSRHTHRAKLCQLHTPQSHQKQGKLDWAHELQHPWHPATCPASFHRDWWHPRKKNKTKHVVPLHLSLKCIEIKEIIWDMAVVYQIQSCA